MFVRKAEQKLLDSDPTALSNASGELVSQLQRWKAELVSDFR